MLSDIIPLYVAASVAMSVQKCCSSYHQYTVFVGIQHLALTEVQACPLRLIGSIEVLAPWDSAGIKTVDVAVTSTRICVENVLRYGAEEHRHDCD
jgi:hypothetical protein